MHHAIYAETTQMTAISASGRPQQAATTDSPYTCVMLVFVAYVMEKLQQSRKRYGSNIALIEHHGRIFTGMGTGMRKLSGLAAGAAVLFGGAALAADVGTRPGSQERVFGWSGFYLGGHAGYAAGKADTAGTLDPNNPFGNSAPAAQPAYNANMSPSLKPNGFAGGGTAGANWQKGALVWGLEGDFGAFGLSRSATTSVTPPGHVGLTSSTSVSADWLGTVRGRVGFAFGHSLLYATAGAAFTDLRSGQTSTYATLGPRGVENFSAANLRTGVAAGGGWEYMLLPDWSGKIEYLHLDFGTLSGAGSIPIQSVNVTHATTVTADVVRAGVNYRFVTW